MRAISYEVVPGLQAEVRLEGDIFEMEDQRNWTDASFKTYSTPLALPLPVQVVKGTRIAQSVTLTLTGHAPQVWAAPSPKELTLTVGQGPHAAMPRLGLAVAGHGKPLSGRELERLEVLQISHLRADVHLASTAWEAALHQATTEANALDVPLEIALYLSDAAQEELASLIDVLERVRPQVCTWLIYHEPERSSGRRWIVLARQYLEGYDARAKVGGGTDNYYAQLNRDRPDADLVELIAYSLNPQVHATDNTSLVEALETQAVTVGNARKFAAGRPLAISPITLKPRHNPSATTPGPAAEELIAAGRLPPQVDVRQMSLLGAAWTVGSLKYVCESGAYSVTYYETSGWRGVMETERGSPLPEAFRSLPGAVYPLYHVLADVGAYASGVVLPTVSSEPLRVVGLALSRGKGTRLLVANLRPEVQCVEIQNLPARVWIRRLDETNAEEAMRRPDTFRAQRGEERTAADGTLALTLLPYAVARVNNTPG
jgi:hypothetical protein